MTLPEELDPQPTLVTRLYAGNVVQDDRWTGGAARTVARVHTMHVVEFEELAGHADSITVPLGTRVQARHGRRRRQPLVIVPVPGDSGALDLEGSWENRDLDGVEDAAGVDRWDRHPADRG